MKKTFLVLAVCALAGSVLRGQDPWSLVWRMTQVPYLTVQDITEMGMVKAGFDTDQDGWGEFICTWTDLDTNAILMYEATGDNTYELVWSWVYPYNASVANTYAGIAVGDINNNGVVDIVTTLPSVVGADPNPPRLWVFEWNGVTGENDYGFPNSGTGGFDPSASWNFDVPDNYDLRPYSLTIEDIDKDGANELIAGIRAAGDGTTRRSTLRLFRGTSADSSCGTSSGSTPSRSADHSTVSRPATWTMTETGKCTRSSGTASR